MSFENISLHDVLERVYDDMMPFDCENMKA
jgi:hypothetical protein